MRRLCDGGGRTRTYYHNGGENTSATKNPFTYRGYYYDRDFGFYYLVTRYYDPIVKRFISADGYVSTGQGLTGYNMYAYCGNNPVNNVDPIGQDWWHWALGAVIVAACAAATVVTCGGFAAATTAVCMVGSGVAAATTTSTIAAGAFIGTATAYGAAVTNAALSSNSIDEFNGKGSWSTVSTTVISGFVGGIAGYDLANSQLPKGKQDITTGTNRAQEHGAKPNSRYIQYDQSSGKIRSDVVYNSNGDWYSRVDYMHSHNINGINYSPHIHISAPLDSQGRPVGRQVVLPW